MLQFSSASISAAASSAACTPPESSVGKSRRNRSGHQWTVAATILACLSAASTTLAFQSKGPLHLSLSNQLHQDQQPSGPRLRYHQQWAVTDPDTLLRESFLEDGAGQKERDGLEKIYMASKDLERMLVDLDEGVQQAMGTLNEQKADASNESQPVLKSSMEEGDNGEQQQLPTEQSITDNSDSKTQFKRVHKRKRVANRTTSGGQSRSSTMPGFAATTNRQRAFDDGMKLAESRSGKDLSKLYNTKEARAARKAKQGEAMYKNSDSVPDSLVQFANEIHMEDRITPTEEKELGTLTQEAIKLQTMYENLQKQLDREPTDEEWCAAAGKINIEAIRQAMEAGLEAKNKLVTANLRMVQGVVNIYIRNGLSGQYNAGDLMSEGILALIRAAEKFEPQRGFRFSTYAMYWIRSAVKGSQMFQSRVITVPNRVHANHKRLLKNEKELRQLLGRKPTTKELCEAVGMSEVQVKRCKQAMDQRIYSLDQTISNTFKPNSGDQNKDTMYEVIASKTDDGEYKKVQQAYLREDLIETLKRHLTPAEVELLLLRFGMMDETRLPPGYEGPLTISQVSQLVGLKPDKVRRLILKSLKQLKFVIGEEWYDFEQLLA